MDSACPVCGKEFSVGLEQHVNVCLDLSALKERVSASPRRSQILSQFRAKLSTKTAPPSQPKLPPRHGKCRELYGAGGLQTPRGYGIPYLKTMMGTRYAVDAFKWGPLEDCHGYFLTHFHSDHYDGLSAAWQGQATIYCSEVTARLVTLRLHLPPATMTPLPMNSWVELADVRVMLLDANHCPGSVMLLFHVKASDKLILHTGDCRAGPSLLSDPNLHRALVGRRLHTIYLDTTYCAPQHTFPCQTQVIQECTELVRTVVEDRKQVRFSPIRRLVCVGSYVIGKERIALAIAMSLGTKIHVAEWKRKVLCTFDWPELTDRLTDDPLEASVHIVAMNVLNKEGLSSYLEPFYPKQYTNILAIRPTGWTGTKTATHSHDYHGPDANGQVRTRKQALTVHSVPYSEHSSFNELSSLLASLKPEFIIPTVGNDALDCYIQPCGASPVETLLYWHNLSR